MKKHVRFGAVLASALVLAACGGAQGDERSDRRDRSEESRDSRDDRNSGSDREEGTREETRRDNASEERTSSRDATNQNFVMRNNTGQTVMRVFVSPVTSNNWEEDVLGSDVLPDRQTVRINFDRGENQCNWDLKVDLADGTSREQRNINLCRVAEVEVTD